MSSVLITGAAGFLGTHLCKLYLNRGYRVIGVDNFLTGFESNVLSLKSAFQDFDFFKGDVCDPKLWEDLGKQVSGLDRVFHLASPASPQKYLSFAFETIWANTLGLECALNFADQRNAKLVFASTSEIYGHSKSSSQVEEDWGFVNSFGSRACYTEAKRCGEAILYAHNRKFKTEHGLVRIFNTYGPHMDLFDGRVVTNFFVQALSNQPLTLFGSGNQSRSLCYVDDLVKGIATYADKNICVPVNLGNPEELSVREIAQKILRIVGKDPSQESAFSYHPMPEDDPPTRKPDISKALSLLGPWSPKVRIDEGLDKTYSWINKQFAQRTQKKLNLNQVPPSFEGP